MDEAFKESTGMKEKYLGKGLTLRIAILSPGFEVGSISTRDTSPSSCSLMSLARFIDRY